MNLDDIRKLVFDWGSDRISSDFGEEHMQSEISLLGLDSIDIVEFCEYLEKKTGVYVDFEWVMGLETLNDLVHQIKVKLTN